jgi:hypothetical protein
MIINSVSGSAAQSIAAGMHGHFFPEQNANLTMEFIPNAGKGKV